MNTSMDQISKFPGSGQFRAGPTGGRGRRAITAALMLAAALWLGPSPAVPASAGFTAGVPAGSTVGTSAFPTQNDRTTAAIDVEKEGEVFVSEGVQYVAYSIDVTNIGDVDMYVDSLVDSLLGDITLLYFEICNGPLLNPGSNCPLPPLVYRILPSDPDPLVNRVEVTASGTLPDGTPVGASDVDVIELDILRPSIDVEKEGEILKPYGDLLLYTFDITNTGDTPLLVTSIQDDIYGDFTGLADESGCSELAPGGNCTIHFQSSIPNQPPDPLVNTVTVTYHTPETVGATLTVSDTDSHELNLFQPSIAVDKTGPQQAARGDQVTYVYTITNTSSTDTPPLCLISAYDDRLGELNVPGGDCDLYPGDTTVVTAAYTIPWDTQEDPFTNTVSVAYHVFEFRTTVFAEDEHAIDLIELDGEVGIDIWPLVDENPIAVDRDHLVPVAILSAPGFNAPAEVDRSTLTFGRTGTEPSLDQCLDFVKDVNGDSLPDLLCLFRSRLAGFQLGDSQGILRFRTLAGQALEGRDIVRVIRIGLRKFFFAGLLGDNEIPPVETSALGLAVFTINNSRTQLQYLVAVESIPPVTGIHIHCAPPGVNGPVGVTLFSGGPTAQTTFTGSVTRPDPGNACGWTTLSAVIQAIRNGQAYINVHTTVHPAGEIRGQIFTVHTQQFGLPSTEPDDSYVIFIPNIVR